MNEEINEAQPRSSLVIDVSEQYSSLSSCVELAKHIMNSAVCEINLFDSYYQTSEVRDVDKNKTPRIESICYDTIREELYEVEDLTEHPGCKDHSCVKHEPYFRYYCGAKLTMTNGTEVGSICVLDTRSKRASNNQKKQLRQLAHLVMHIIEYESENRGISTNLKALSRACIN